MYQYLLNLKSSKMSPKVSKIFLKKITFFNLNSHNHKGKEKKITITKHEYHPISSHKPAKKKRKRKKVFFGAEA